MWYRESYCSTNVEGGPLIGGGYNDFYTLECCSNFVFTSFVRNVCVYLTFKVDSLNCVSTLLVIVIGRTKCK